MSYGWSYISGLCRHQYVKMEDDVIAPIKPIFYKRYVDNTYKEKWNTKDKLFKKLNTYHDNIKLL